MANRHSIKRPDLAARNFKHGQSKTKLYVRWAGMIARCKNPNHIAYKNYGGRGITVCERWCGPEGILNFLADMGPPPTPAHKIDRIDNDGNYEPGNCCWATNKANCNHARHNRILEHDGLRLTLAQWSERLGINAMTISFRIDRYGWTVAAALTTPVLSFSEAAKRGGTARWAKRDNQRRARG